MFDFQIKSTFMFLSLCAAVSLFIVLRVIYVIRKSPNALNRYPRLIAIIVWHIFLFAVTVYATLLLLPLDWAGEKSLQVANEFMSNLSNKDYASARTLLALSNKDTEGYNKIRPSLENPINRPVSWELKVTGWHSPFYVVTGNVVLLNNKSVPVDIYIDWEWETFSWKIDGIRYNPYGDSLDKNDIRFLAHETDREFIIKATFILVLIVSEYISIKFLSKLLKIKSGKMVMENSV